MLSDQLLTCEKLKGAAPSSSFELDMQEISSGKQSSVLKAVTEVTLPGVPVGTSVAVRTHTKKSEAAAILPIRSEHVVHAYAWLQEPCPTSDSNTAMGILIMKLLAASDGWKTCAKSASFEICKAAERHETVDVVTKSFDISTLLMNIVGGLEACVRSKLVPMNTASVNVMVQVDSSGEPTAEGFKLIDLDDYVFPNEQAARANVVEILKGYLRGIGLDIALSKDGGEAKGVCSREGLSDAARDFCIVTKADTLSAYQILRNEDINPLLKANGGRGMWDLVFYLTDLNDEEVAGAVKRLIAGP